ncbi:cytosolic phospholipase A2-like isoform X1 [Xenia sp. Carnegie-2017]|uniref:cytosolic phospholipase A2-like isoform X1 n=1 Tax=Xenia sp. Carnegie-2017 TaxID=2897299 RepID=UPI001F04FAD5|nr:cytosolic phospholipase A2-like isoform X1 [Xenia sp. Carnegie-2017]XP_046861059.1 cytosolic phospholipase A2-like isoform X1 [Xenia sp. Carnegie-2017]
MFCPIKKRLNEVMEWCFEWVEFTPFEYGSRRLGVFGKTSHFGVKYYKGRLVTEYGEPPLHFLQGVWGSAFSIILNSLKDDDEKRGKNHKDELVSAIKIDVDNCKTEENDSEDEDKDKNKPEDEVDNKGWVTQMLNPKNIFATRKGKAAECFDFCRGLKLKNKNGTVGGKDAVFKNKTMCVVDSGIAFNSPFPVLLRPERKVELILSFDFSQRDNGDKEPPFHELLKAEKWARENKYPFPNIKDNPLVKDSEAKDSEIRECYVFKDENDPNCPTILHFPIVNNSFREYLSPGVKREKDDDIKFANFDIFDDPDEPYSSFKFEYKLKTFERLHELIKYNTLVSIDLIKGKIIDIVKYRRKHRKYAKKHSGKKC